MKSLITKALDAIFLSVGIYTMLFVAVEYFRQHYYYIDGFFKFAYFDLLFFFVPIYILFYLLFVSEISFERFEAKFINLTGWKILVGIIGLATLIFAISSSRTGLFDKYSFLPSATFFLYKFLYIILSIFLLTILQFGVGNRVLSLIFQSDPNLAENFRQPKQSVVIGMIVLTLLAFFLAFFGQFNFPAILIVVGLLAVASYKSIWKIFKICLIDEIVIERPVKFKILILLSIVILTATVNVMNIIRPFPIGWDDGSVYMNFANLMFKSGNLVSGGAAYYGSMMMSIGLVLFRSTEVALGIALSGSWLSMIAIFDLSRKFLNKSNSFLILAIFTILPSIVFQSSVDMKIDLLLLFVGIVAVTETFSLLSNIDSLKKHEIFKYIFLIGAICGFAFGMKYTTFILILGIVGVIIRKYFGNFGVTGVIFGGILAVFKFGLYKFSGIEFEPDTLQFFSITSAFGFIISASLVIWQNLKDKLKLIEFIQIMIVFAISSLVVFSPWVLKNYLETRNFSTNSILYGRSLTPVIRVETQNFASLPGVGVQNLEPQPSNPTGAHEEVVRYIGYDNGLLRYINLPYTVVMNTIVKSKLVDISYILLLILPIEFLIMVRRRNRLTATTGLVFYLIFLIFLPFTNLITTSLCENSPNTSCVLEGVANLSKGSPLFFWCLYLPVEAFIQIYQPIYNFFGSFGEILTLSSVVFAYWVHILIMLKYFGFDEKLRNFALFIAIYMFFWLLLASGIYWYGMIGFIFLLIFVFIYKRQLNKSDLVERITNFSINFFIIIWMIFALPLMLVPSRGGMKYIIKSTFDDYATGNANSTDTLKSTDPAYLIAVDTMNRDKNDKIFRVGTQLVYFIDDNDSRVLTDNQLDIFKSIYTSSNSKEEIAYKLSKSGFRYLLIDFGVDSIDETIEGTLRQKSDMLDDFIAQNPKLKLITTNRLVLDEKGDIELEVGGKKIKARRGLEGEIVEGRKGNMALFEILE